MFRRIGEYISLELFYFVNFISSSLIPYNYVYNYALISCAVEKKISVLFIDTKDSVCCRLEAVTG